MRQAAAGLAARQFTARELIAAFLARCGRFNPAYNAITIFNELALREAEDVDRRLVMGERLGPLAGIPIVIKDTIDVAGLPTTGGWVALDPRTAPIRLIPRNDAPAVSRLRNAGAIILGKTNTSALCVGSTNTDDSGAGRTINAANPQFCPGASSAGSATAVAASLAIIGLGVETGGSIQNPAAAQALVGMKPTFGLVPNIGVLPIASSTRDVVGPIARTAQDVAIVMDALVGSCPVDARIRSSDFQRNMDGTLEGKRIGTYGPGWRQQDLSNEAAALYESALFELERQGAQLVPDPFHNTNFASLAEPAADGYDARGEETVIKDWDAYLAQYEGDLGISSMSDLINVVGRDPFAAGEPFEYLAPYKHRSAKAFANTRRSYVDLFLSVMDGKQLDALVFPQAVSWGPRVGEKLPIAETTVSEINIGGFPAITAPAGYYKNGFPFEIIIVGRPWADAQIIALAGAFMSRQLAHTY